MTPCLLHKFWALVENTQSSVLLNFDDARLEQWLISQLRDIQNLSPHEVEPVSHYVHTRIQLIREMAYER